ncbi:unnamed protein product [Parascedosporium putredinis]|uniref:Uncharacterized protein n=1 Tax=Parascedosporium putredinis TaxID=1442378 RepID=A0A9P1H6Z7_9PEZI|nr:unnamed protein product [Parascedosporium putredinis]CAI7998002.1 unnamed protein product [Parascedosporium putredinis]
MLRDLQAAGRRQMTPMAYGLDGKEQSALSGLKQWINPIMEADGLALDFTATNLKTPLALVHAMVHTSHA